MEYEIPEPSENPQDALVINYKICKGIEFDDRVWDKRHFARCARSAKMLLDICEIYEAARRCLEELGKEFEERGLNWTLETVTSHAHDWKKKRGRKDEQQIRKRFYDALSEQRTKGKDLDKGKLVTGREILGPLGNLEVFPGDRRNKDRTSDSDDGEPGSGLGPPGLEDKTA